MTPVITSTNRERLRMDLAGVEAGAKIFVGLENAEESAKQADVRQNNTGSIFKSSRFVGLFAVLCINSSLSDISGSSSNNSVRTQTSACSVPYANRLNFDFR